MHFGVFLHSKYFHKKIGRLKIVLITSNTILLTFSNFCRNQHNTKCRCIQSVLRIRIRSLRTVYGNNTDKVQSVFSCIQLYIFLAQWTAMAMLSISVQACHYLIRRQNQVAWILFLYLMQGHYLSWLLIIKHFVLSKVYYSFKFLALSIEAVIKHLLNFQLYPNIYRR